MNFFAIFRESLIITGIVIVMMLIIEYFHIRTKGNLLNKLQRTRFVQILISAVLGAIPGCFGAYITVSLYTHNIITIPALAASFIATYGDETFVLLSIQPKSAILISFILFFLSIIIGIILWLIFKQNIPQDIKHLKIHYNSNCIMESDFRSSVIQNLKNITFERFLILAGLIIFIISLIYSILHHSHHESIENHSHNLLFFETWMQYLVLILAVFLLYFIVRVPTHFLQEHLWEHIFRKHSLKIFLWIFFTITLISLLLKHTSLSAFVQQHDAYLWLVLTAILIGLIPQSGPHIIFIVLYSKGLIPLSILLINSIVQEGHGGLPLLAESKKTFLIVKTIKVLIGIVVGLIGFSLNF